MICPNCGRRNSAGATFCSRCHQRLPLASKLNGSHRRTFVIEPRGGGGSGAIVLGVALLAGFLFIGGAAAIYLSGPPAGSADPTHAALASGSPTLPPFVQPTATPTASPTFILLPSDSPSYSPLPTETGSVLPSVVPQTPTPAPTAASAVAKFAWSQEGTSKKVNFVDRSTGGPTQWAWSFGDGEQSDQPSPSHTYAAYGSYTVTLVVTGPDGKQSFKQRDIVVQAPPCDQHGQPEGCIASPTPSPTPPATPTPPPTPLPTVVVPSTPVAPSASPSFGPSAP